MSNSAEQKISAFTTETANPLLISGLSREVILSESPEFVKSLAQACLRSQALWSHPDIASNVSSSHDVDETLGALQVLRDENFSKILSNYRAADILGSTLNNITQDLDDIFFVNQSLQDYTKSFLLDCLADPKALCNLRNIRIYLDDPSERRKRHIKLSKVDEELSIEEQRSTKTEQASKFVLKEIELVVAFYAWINADKSRFSEFIKRPEVAALIERSDLDEEDLNDGEKLEPPIGSLEFIKHDLAFQKWRKDNMPTWDAIADDILGDPSIPSYRKLFSYLPSQSAAEALVYDDHIQYSRLPTWHDFLFSEAILNTIAPYLNLSDAEVEFGRAQFIIAGLRYSNRDAWFEILENMRDQELKSYLPKRSSWLLDSKMLAHYLEIIKGEKPEWLEQIEDSQYFESQATEDRYFDEMDEDLEEDTYQTKTAKVMFSMSIDKTGAVSFSPKTKFRNQTIRPLGFLEGLILVDPTFDSYFGGNQSDKREGEIDQEPAVSEEERLSRALTQIIPERLSAQSLIRGAKLELFPHILLKLLARCPLIINKYDGSMPKDDIALVGIRYSASKEPELCIIGLVMGIEKIEN